MKLSPSLSISLLAAALLTVSFSQNASASQRTFSATAEKAQVSLESVQGNPDLYYLQVDNLDSPQAGRPLLVKRTKSNLGHEDFAASKLDFFVRLGGQVANQYAKPPVAGILTFENRDLKLSADDRNVKLASAYEEAECLKSDKAQAQASHQEALALVKDACGTSPKLAIDWSSFEKAKKEGLACNAREALKGLADVCKDADYKKAAAALKTVNVAYGTGEPFKKSGGTWTYTIPNLPENTRFKAAVFLQDNL